MNKNWKKKLNQANNRKPWKIMKKYREPQMSTKKMKSFQTFKLLNRRDYAQAQNIKKTILQNKLLKEKFLKKVSLWLNKIKMNMWMDMWMKKQLRFFSTTSLEKTITHKFSTWKKETIKNKSKLNKVSIKLPKFKWMKSKRIKFSLPFNQLFKSSQFLK